MHIPFDNSYATLPDGFYSRLDPTSVVAPKLLAFNKDLASLLRIEVGDLTEVADVFGGNDIPQDAAPLAQLYAGHQFGRYNPQLGDGRAILLGEVIGTDGLRRDIQLKGSGPTPYSRMGDGRAWLGPVLREYVVSEAMHALGIPTTRALAAVPRARRSTARRRAARRGADPRRRQPPARRHVSGLRPPRQKSRTSRHSPIMPSSATTRRPKARWTCCAQSAPRRPIWCAAWMSVGFIHGVMNTDNCAISGETIDYGPCAFMDAFHHEPRVQLHRPAGPLCLWQPAAASRSGIWRSLPLR